MEVVLMFKYTKLLTFFNENIYVLHSSQIQSYSHFSAKIFTTYVVPQDNYLISSFI